MDRALVRRRAAALRIALSASVLNGAAAAAGLFVISSAMHAFASAFAASVASVGVIVCIAPDQPAPRRRKFWQLVPAALFGLPLFMGVQAVRADPLWVGLLLVPATFVAFLAGAWGRRGIPIVVSFMFAAIFSLAVPPRAGVLETGGWFALGAGLYLVWATAANALLNSRYRTLMVADTLLSLVGLMRAQAAQFVAFDAATPQKSPPVGRLLGQQAALADQLQAARNIVLETPSTPRRQMLAGMLLQVLEMRDHLLACELDLDTLKSQGSHAPGLRAMHDVLHALANDLESLVDALMLGRRPAEVIDHRPMLTALAGDAELPAVGDDAPPPAPATLLRGLAGRVGNIADETRRLTALARGDVLPDLAVVRVAWQMFVSPVTWSWRPLATVWHWDAPPLRHAIRASLAIATAYALSLALPWGTHAYWTLVTIVVVLRGSLAQTLERRNARVAGTLLGCVITGVLLWLRLPLWALLVTLTLAQAVAHAFAIRKYLVTAVAATVLGLVQVHLLSAGSSPVFEVLERIADTLVGATIAWVFSYVLPSWERGQIPALVQRTLSAQARHARVALGLAQLRAVDNEPELAWRLARREAYDSLSALVQATQRSLAEPRAVRPPLEPLGRLLAHSYQLLAQLTAVKTLLLLRRGQLDLDQIRRPLADTADRLESTLVGATSAGSAASDATPSPLSPPAQPPDACGNVSGSVSGSAAGGDDRSPMFAGPDMSPWALRRLALSRAIAAEVRRDADEVLSESRRGDPP